MAGEGYYEKDGKAYDAKTHAALPMFRYIDPDTGKKIIYCVQANKKVGLVQGDTEMFKDAKWQTKFGAAVDLDSMMSEVLTDVKIQEIESKSTPVSITAMIP